MSPSRKILLALASALALVTVQACTSDTELNPQPLPPKDETARTPSDNGGTGGSLGDPQNGTPPVPTGAADAGTEGGDASDGGDG